MTGNIHLLAESIDCACDLLDAGEFDAAVELLAGAAELATVIRKNLQGES